MKWCEYYKELMLNDGNVGQLLAAIATGDGWPAKFVTCEMLDNEGQLIDEKLTDEPEIHLIIESIVSDPKFATFTMVVKTSGELPAGVQHGTYRLTFNTEGIATDLHEEMFRDEEMPEQPPQTE